MMTNYMTTIPGMLILITVLWNAYQTKTINVDDLKAALIGIGLVAAKDWNVTGGDRHL